MLDIEEYTEVEKEQLAQRDYWKECANNRTPVELVDSYYMIGYGYHLNHKVNVSMIVDLDKLGKWCYTDLGWYEINQLRACNE